MTMLSTFQYCDMIEGGEAVIEGGEAVLEGGKAVLPNHQGDGHLLLAHQGEAGHLQATHNLSPQLFMM